MIVIKGSQPGQSHLIPYLNPDSAVSSGWRTRHPLSPSDQREAVAEQRPAKIEPATPAARR